MRAYPVFQQPQSFIKSIVHRNALGRIDELDTTSTGKAIYYSENVRG
jgi:hypothetical protein